MAADRIYVVTDRNGERLIRATNIAQARNHAARADYLVAVASQDTLVTLVARGVKVETAGQEADAG